MISCLRMVRNSCPLQRWLGSRSRKAFSGISSCRGGKIESSSRQLQMNPKSLVKMRRCLPDQPRQPLIARAMQQMDDSAVAGEGKDWSRMNPVPRSSREPEVREFRDPTEEGIRLICIALLPSGLEQLNRRWVSGFENGQAALDSAARACAIQETLT